MPNDNKNDTNEIKKALLNALLKAGEEPEAETQKAQPAEANCDDAEKHMAAVRAKADAFIESYRLWIWQTWENQNKKDE